MKYFKLSLITLGLTDIFITSLFIILEWMSNPKLTEMQIFLSNIHCLFPLILGIGLLYLGMGLESSNSRKTKFAIDNN